MNKLKTQIIKHWQRSTSFSSTSSLDRYTNHQCPPPFSPTSTDLGMSTIISFAYDPVLRILALITDEPTEDSCSLFIYVLIHNHHHDLNSDLKIRVLAPHVPNHIAFHFGTGYLITHTNAHTLSILDLATLQWSPINNIPNIQIMHIGFPGSPWIYLGLMNGSSIVLPFCAVPNLNPQQQVPFFTIKSQSQIPMIPVVSINVHPITPTKVLIVYKDGSGVVWDLIDQAVDTTFVKVKWNLVIPMYTLPVHVTCACWHPIGSYIAVGFDVGYIGIYPVSQSTANPVAVFQVVSSMTSFSNYIDQQKSSNSDVPGSPVVQLGWVSEPTTGLRNGDLTHQHVEQSAIYVAGGISGHPGIICFVFERNSKIHKRPSKIRGLMLSRVFGIIQEFQFITSSPWPVSDPEQLLVRTSTGHLSIINLNNESSPTTKVLGDELPISIQIGICGLIKQLKIIDGGRLSGQSYQSLLKLNNRINTTTSSSSSPTAAFGVISILTTDSGIHFLDLSEPQPVVLAGMSVYFEMVKSVILERLSPEVMDDPQVLAEWYSGISIAWVNIDFDGRVCMYIGLNNGMLMVLRVNDTECIDGISIDHETQHPSSSPLPPSSSSPPLPPSLPASSSPSLLISDPSSSPPVLTSQLSTIDNINYSEPSTQPAETPPIQHTTEPEDLGPWTEISLTPAETELIPLNTKFVPSHLFIPQKPTSSKMAARYKNFLAIGTSVGTIDLYNIHSLSLLQANLDLKMEHLNHSDPSRNSSSKKKKRFSVAFNQRQETTPVDYTITAMVWVSNSKDNTDLRLVVACTEYVFVYQWTNDRLCFQACIGEDKLKDSVSDLVLVVPENHTDSVVTTMCTLAVITLHSVYAFDTDSFAFLAKWKCSKGPIHVVQPLIPDPQNELNLTNTDPKVIVITQSSVHVLTFPHLELVMETQHRIPITNPDMVSVTRDGRILTVSDTNRLCVTALTTKVGSDHQVPIHFDRVNIPTTTKDSAVTVVLPTLSSNPATFVVPLLPPPPNNPVVPINGRLNKLLSYLPFGSSYSSEELMDQGYFNQLLADQLVTPITKTNQQLNQVKDALAQRGEKLELLEHKFSELNNTASSFAQLAKQVRLNQERKKF